MITVHFLAARGAKKTDSGIPTAVSKLRSSVPANRATLSQAGRYQPVAGGRDAWNTNPH